ncbi:MAG: hypothetical protein B7Z15_17965 [Rhizobiales bacterium 32-66-8]|nr:MAG: hypothetical protein B7Z15_17965 [Rhizobiales bacterium 32-66-8]
MLDRVAGEVLRRRTLSGFTCNDLQKLVGDTTNRYATENLTAIDGRRWREIGFERLLLIAESLGLDMETITQPIEPRRRTAACAAEQVAA